MKKQILGYEGLYEIELLENGLSVVTSLERKVKNKNGVSQLVPSKELTECQRHNRNGVTYVHVNLFKDGKVRSVSKAKLIAESFIENPDGFQFVRFLDGDTLNLNIKNIKWVSRDERYDCTQYGNRDIDRRNIIERESKIPTKYINEEGFRRETNNSIRYLVRVNYNKKRYHIGTFEHLYDAQYARDWMEDAIKRGIKFDRSDLGDNAFIHQDLRKFLTNEYNVEW